jgi:hypothetical protein
MTDAAIAAVDESTVCCKSKRLRRMWIVVALVLCMGAYFAWRYAHRGDPRFVGQWIVHGHPYENASMKLEFTRFGTVKQRLSEAGQETTVLECAWRVEGEHLNFYLPQEGSLRERMQVFLADIWRRWQGEPQINVDSYHFEQVGADRFRFRKSVASEAIEFELTRIEDE